MPARSCSGNQCLKSHLKENDVNNDLINLVHFFKYWRMYKWIYFFFSRIQEGKDLKRITTAKKKSHQLMPAEKKSKIARREASSKRKINFWPRSIWRQLMIHIIRLSTNIRKEMRDCAYTPHRQWLQQDPNYLKVGIKA